MMTPNEVLTRYFKIADMVDLRLLAVQYASDGKYDHLELVVKEIENRILLDKERTQRIIEKDVEDRT